MIRNDHIRCFFCFLLINKLREKLRKDHEMKYDNDNFYIPAALFHGKYGRHLQSLDLILYGFYFEEHLKAKNKGQVDIEGDVYFTFGDNELTKIFNNPRHELLEAKQRLEYIKLITYKNYDRHYIYLHPPEIDDEVAEGMRKYYELK